MSRFIILTKSGMKKTINGIPCSGVCVAAYSLAENKLVRFVQEPLASPLFGSYVRNFDVLDEVEVSEYKNAPDGPQTENMLIHENGIKTVRKSPMLISDIAERIHLEQNQSYLVNMKPSLDAVDSYNHSIEIVQVSDLSINKFEYSSQPRATFRIGTRVYRKFRVTDGQIKSHFDLSTEPLHYDEAFLVITIPSIPYEKDGKYYKMVAAVFSPEANNETSTEMIEVDELPF